MCVNILKILIILFTEYNVYICRRAAASKNVFVLSGTYGCKTLLTLVLMTDEVLIPEFCWNSTSKKEVGGTETERGQKDPHLHSGISVLDFLYCYNQIQNKLKNKLIYLGTLQPLRLLHLSDNQPFFVSDGPILI